MNEDIVTYVAYWDASQSAETKARFALAEAVRLRHSLEEKWRIIAEKVRFGVITKGAYWLPSGRYLFVGDNDYPRPAHVVNP